MSATTFKYKAVNAMGKAVAGTVVAADEGEVFRRLSADALTPLSIAPAGSSPLSLMSGSRLSAKDLGHFTYQLSVLVGARLSLSEGLRALGTQEKPGRLRDMIEELVRRIESGEKLSAALENYKDSVGSVYVETLRAAEQSGKLAEALEHLAEMIDRNEETRRQIRGAMMYPAMTLVVLGLAGVFLTGWVVPRFAKIFASRKVALPGPTQLVMDVGNSLQTHWWAYLIGVVAAAGAAALALRSPAVRLLLDGCLHRVPVVSGLLRAAATARFARVVGLCLESGLGLIDAIRLGGRASGRPTLDAECSSMADRLRSGARLGEIVGSCAYFGTFTQRMLAAGEKSGELSRMCGVVARQHEREASHTIKNLTTLIEPLLILLVAGFVLTIALSIFLPMWSMMQLAGG